MWGAAVFTTTWSGTSRISIFIDFCRKYNRKILAKPIIKIAGLYVKNFGFLLKKECSLDIYDSEKHHIIRWEIDILYLEFFSIFKTLMIFCGWRKTVAFMALDPFFTAPTSWIFVSQQWKVFINPQALNFKRDDCKWKNK